MPSLASRSLSLPAHSAQPRYHSALAMSSSISRDRSRLPSMPVTVSAPLTAFLAFGSIDGKEPAAAWRHRRQPNVLRSSAHVRRASERMTTNQQPVMNFWLSSYSHDSHLICPAGISSHL
jgi:hypothetical protein